LIGSSNERGGPKNIPALARGLTSQCTGRTPAGLAHLCASLIGSVEGCSTTLAARRTLFRPGGARPPTEVMVAFINENRSL
jgi:hypothetical protein